MTLYCFFLFTGKLQITQQTNQNKKFVLTFFHSPPHWEYIKAISMLFLPDNLGKCMPVEADADNLGKCKSISIEFDAENLATMDI